MKILVSCNLYIAVDGCTNFLKLDSEFLKFLRCLNAKADDFRIRLKVDIEDGFNSGSGSCASTDASIGAIDTGGCADSVPVVARSRCRRRTTGTVGAADSVAVVARSRCRRRTTGTVGAAGAIICSVALALR